MITRFCSRRFRVIALALAALTTGCATLPEPLRTTMASVARTARLAMRTPASIARRATLATRAPADPRVRPRGDRSALPGRCAAQPAFHRKTLRAEGRHAGCEVALPAGLAGDDRER